MAETVDSLSIELTASTQSAEDSIDRLIGKLNQLKSAVSGASNFNMVVQGIARIAAVASGIDGDAGRKLNHLAAGLTALSKVGDLSNLKDAGKNLASVMKAVSGDTGGKGLSGLADGIKQTNDALGGIKDSDVSKLGAVRDALSGEMSGSLHQANQNVIEHPALGGSVAQNYDLGLVNPGAVSIYEQIAYALNEATAAHRAFRAEIGSGGGIAGLLGEGGIGGAITVFTHVADSIRDATAAFMEFQAALGGGPAKMLTGSIGGNNEGPWVADEIRDAALAYDDLGNSASSAADIIETEFVNNSETTFNHFNNALWNVGNTAIQTGKYLGNSIGTALLNVGKGIIGLGQQIARIAKYRLIRALLKEITQSYKDLYGWSKLSGTDFANSMDKINTAFLYLRNSIVSMVAPLVNALAPALDFIIDKVVEVLNWFNQFFAAISGAETYTVAKKYKQTWGDTFKDTSKEAQEATDEIKRTIMGFDEINKLQKKTIAGHDASGSSPYSSGYEYMFEERPLSSGFQGFGNAIETALQDSLSRITMIVGAAELAVGALLALSGANVPLGLALMATGAVTMGSAIVANWDGIPDNIKLVIGAVEAALGGGLAVGAILAFSSGNIGLGIGMMVAALSLEWSAVNIVWTTLKDKIGGQIQTIGVLVGGATFGLGAVLAFAGHPGIGIAMMIAGASVAAVSINWNYLKEKLQGPIGTVTALISGASLVLGFLAIVGGMIPLGLGLILAGAAGLATTVAANWDNLTDFFSDLWENIKTAAEDTWETLKDIGAGIWERIKEGVTGAVQGVGGWIKEHIFQPFINAWHWLLGLFGGGGDDTGLASNAGHITANAAMANASSGSGVIDDIAEGTTDRESIQKLKQIGATMGDAIKQGLNDRLKNISGEIWNTIVTGWSAETRELPVSAKISTTSSISVPESVNVNVSLVKKWTGTALAALGLDSLSATISMAMVKSWKVTALEWLGLDSLSATISMAMVKSWKVAALEWLGLDSLSATISMAMVKSWKVTALEWLGLDSLSATISMAMVKSWKVTALAWLGLDSLSATISMAMVKTWKVAALEWLGLDNLSATVKVTLEYIEPEGGFGGAIGGGGSTSGGGAGRTIKISVEPETTVGGKSFWERAKEAIDAAGTAVDKGLDVVVRPALNAAGDRITSIVKWLFGNDNTPNVTTKVNASAGTGFSSVSGNKFTIGGVKDTSAKVNGIAGTGFSGVQATGNCFTLNPIAPANATINGVPGTGFTGTLSGKHKYTLAGIEDANVGITPKKSNDWEQQWSDMFGDEIDQKVKLNIVKGTVESSIQGFVGNVGKAITTIVEVGLEQSKKTWVASAYTALTKTSNTPTSTVSLAQNTKSWVANAWTALTKASNTPTSTVSLAQNTKSWVANAWTALTKTGNTPTSTVSLAQDSYWNGNAWTALTRANNKPTSTVSLVQDSYWNGNAWTALTRANNKPTSTVSLVQSSYWDNSAWTALTRANNKPTSTVSLVQGNSWDGSAWTALTRANNKPKSTVSLVQGNSWNGRAWTALTRANNKPTSTVSLVQGNSWNGSAYTALTKANNSATADVSLAINTADWNGSAYTALTKANNSATADVSLAANTAYWNGSAYTALTKRSNSATADVSLAANTSHWDNDAWKVINLKSVINKTIEITLNIAKGVIDGLKKLLGIATGGVIANGKFRRFESGGVINNSFVRKLPHYAGGTTDAHGTLFVAGEAGPEILGHIGGRTEILNQSQLAQTMFAAVRSAMTGVKIGGSIENAVSMDNSDADYETMYRAMYDAFTDAMAGSNERDKEKVALMREIAAKEFTAEVTAASMNRAQTRMNRRAGTTIVPVGT